MEADVALKRAVGLNLGPSGAAGLVHLVVPVPVELNGSVVTTNRLKMLKRTMCGRASFALLLCRVLLSA